jgi:nucleotide-binding universal stress UspA family protein
MFPTKVLLATDGSEDAAAAARIASELADKTGAELHVAYVEYLPAAIDYEMKRITEANMEGKRKKAEGFLTTQTELIADAGGSVAEAHLRMGSPDKEIVVLAEELGASLIVLGSRGLGGVRRALMGSVSDSVVRHAHCPVLVARQAGDEGESASTRQGRGARETWTHIGEAAKTPARQKAPSP